MNAIPSDMTRSRIEMGLQRGGADLLLRIAMYLIWANWSASVGGWLFIFSCLVKTTKWRQSDKVVQCNLKIANIYSSVPHYNAQVTKIGLKYLKIFLGPKLSFNKKNSQNKSNISGFEFHLFTGHLHLYGRHWHWMPNIEGYSEVKKLPFLFVTTIPEDVGSWPNFSAFLASLNGLS